MGLSKASISGLQIFRPSSIQNNDIDFLETLKFETKNFRKQDYLDKARILDLFFNRIKSIKPKKPIPAKKTELTKLMEEFFQKLGKTLIIKNEDTLLSNIKWDRIDDLCNTLRRVERSEERKVRWALYYLWRSGKSKILIQDVTELLADFKIKNISKIILKIINEEKNSGLVAEFTNDTLEIKHQIDDKLVWHYLADAIEESFRRPPGEIEREILQLIDEGSYSASDISDILLIDEATISRVLAKLRKNDKIILSSFGERGSRYFTTNCDNCPFGTTKASCRKNALSYIIDYFQTCFGVELNAFDFEQIEENQAILKIKRIISEAKKAKNTKLERNISQGLAELFGTVVEKSLTIKLENVKNTQNIELITNKKLFMLPVLFHLGLYKGSETTYELINQIMKITKTIPKKDRENIIKLVEKHSEQFLRYAGINEKF